MNYCKFIDDKLTYICHSSKEDVFWPNNVNKNALCSPTDKIQKLKMNMYMPEK